MNIPVVLAILVVFGLLGFRRANLFTWAIAWWVGVLRLLPIWIRRADSHVRHLDLHGHRLARDPGIRVLEPGAS